MTILQGDIKFVAAKKMTETPDGGGPPSANIIGDAVSNAIFGDISEQMRAGGKVNVKSVFAAVQSLDTDEFLGAHAILSKPPQDPLVSVTLAKAGIFDTRGDIVPKLSAYLNASSEWPAMLLEAHIAGQRALQLFARPGADLPPVGRTLVLQWHYGQADQREQYVRITRVSSELRTFSYATGGEVVDYQAMVVTADLSDALAHDFPGTAPNRLYTRDATATIVRDTVVADASQYFGASALASPIAVGDVSLNVESVYTQLVPNSRTETPITDRRPAADAVLTLATSPRLVEVDSSPFSQRIRIGQENRGYSYVTILRPLPAPGALRISFRALGRNYGLADDGNGHITGAGSGTINYMTGAIAVTLAALPDARSALVFHWGEATRYTNRAGNTQFRPPEYAFDLDHAGVTPGSWAVSWESEGIIRSAVADASGVISGDAVGEISHVAGRVYLRPLYMIDPGGEFALSYTWSEVQEQVFTGLSADAAGAVTVSLAEVPVPGSVEVHWLTSREMSDTSGASSTAGATTKTSSNGTQAQQISTTRVLPAYTYVSGQGGGNNGIGMGAVFETVPEQVVTDRQTVYSTFAKDGSTSATYSTASAQTSRRAVAVEHVVTDDGAGHFFGTLGTVSYAGKSLTIKVAGDYSESSYESNYENAGAFESLNSTGEPSATLGGAAPTVAQGGGGSNTAKGGAYGTASAKETFGSSGLTVRYKVGTASPQSAAQTYTPPGIVIDLCPRTQDYLVPGSVQFQWMGATYSDLDGLLYRGRTASLPGVLSGMLDYRSGLALMFDYLVGPNPTLITLESLWTTRRAPTLANVVFNLPSAPAAPGSLVFSLADVNGAQILATSDLTGAVTGPHVRGQTDFETGLVEIQFGDYVLDSALTAAQKAEWWYNPDDVRIADGKIWRPWPVDPSTLRYSVVGYAYLPLDAEILGMDPVRLPPDGRVPIYRAGGYVVIGHTGAVGPINVSVGQTISCGRTRISRIRVVDADGNTIDTGYTTNLDAGTVTFAAARPAVTIFHRIEDLVVLSDVQIDGQLRATRAITHDYPSGAIVSSALMWGDLRASVTDVWDQVSWTGVWTDDVIGQPATGTYNDTIEPIHVLNADALAERWAVVFTNTNAFYVMGEHVGVIATGNTATDCAPLNPATGRPYFTLPAIGWGSGWSAGNVLRFNTDGPTRKVVLIRTTQPGPEPAFIDHDFELLIRGGIDRP